MTHSNSEILAAVLNHFSQPLIKELAGMRLSQTSGFQMVENVIRKWLPVSPDYSLMNDLSFIFEGATSKTVVPLLSKSLATIPDDMIPNLAHSIVDSALSSGKLDFIEGKIKFTQQDFQDLKNLLNYNLPLKETEEYKVLLSPQKEREVKDGATVATDK